MKRIAFPQVGAEPEGAPPRLTRFAWLSIAAAVLTISLKSEAYLGRARRFDDLRRSRVHPGQLGAARTASTY
jgi:hypothetical protein